jgi:hypothetical protein
VLPPRNLFIDRLCFFLFLPLILSSFCYLFKIKNKGWAKLPGFESKVMYMVEDLPEEGDATAEFTRKSSGVQEVSFVL